MAAHKYKAFNTVELPDRRWPSRTISKAPQWCSVDLRDGNQALASPMNIRRKREMFRLLVDIGFKEIEVGFPAASQTEFDFVRHLIEEDMIPEDVTIQVITQARDHLIQRTFEALRGVRRAIVNLYVPTSPVQREVVLRRGRGATVELAVQGAKQIRREAELLSGADIQFKFCPESFSITEPDYALEVCEEVIDAWMPSTDKKIILNLAASVEASTPNVYADQVEWFCRNIRQREDVIISVHVHNDRGTAVAATELALLAGAERVEGALFGNGERAGNADIITLALNMFSQGIDPGLDISSIERIIEVFKVCTGLPVHIRHPYAGEMVFTTFAGSHQDAIRKGLKRHHLEKSLLWHVPYLPIDPADIGRGKEQLVRINSQSGKGGVAYVLEKEFGLCRSPALESALIGIIRNQAEAKTSELSPADLKSVLP